ncbi:MAG TPA: glycosyltransferase family 1 protein [Thermoleophilaceae bacterium]|nr:glycosyltransferase family 1 protein [Thermoleophilaceae bacterium]
MSVFGIDARAAADEPAGRGRFVREVLRALATGDDGHDWRLYARRAWDGAALGERFEWRLSGEPDPLWHLRAARRASAECDAFLSTNSYLTTWFLSVPAVPVVHDLIPFDPALRPRLRTVWIERATLGRCVRRSAAIVTPSEATSRALTERFPAARGKVRVAPLGGALPEPGELPAGVPPRGFVLAAGTLEPRKNLPRLVAAYASLPPGLREAHPLVVVGPRGWETGETERALASLGESCISLGFVSDEQLAALYGACAVFCYPSLGEGFGLPVLEAMGAGAAVVTSDRSSLPEVGGDAAEYCDPESEASIAEALERLLGDPARRAELGARARERAAGFGWEGTAATIVATLEEVSR